MLDKCNVCNANVSDDCRADCAGAWGGSKAVDECNVCAGSGGLLCGRGVGRMCFACPVVIVSTIAIAIEDVQKNRSAFEASFKAGIAQLLSSGSSKVAASRVTITSIVAGSVAVTWYIAPGGAAGAPSAKAATQQFKAVSKGKTSLAIGIFRQTAFKEVDSGTTGGGLRPTPETNTTAIKKKEWHEHELCLADLIETADTTCVATRA